jgi:hypothetical protein
MGGPPVWGPPNFLSDRAGGRRFGLCAPLLFAQSPLRTQARTLGAALAESFGL